MGGLEAAFGGDAEGGGVIGVDDAGEGGGEEAVAAPVEESVDGFGGVAAAMLGGGEDPADLGCVEGWGDGAVVVEEADFADEVAGGFFFDEPGAEAEQRPVAGVAEETCPGLFGGEGLAADVADDDGVGP